MTEKGAEEQVLAMERLRYSRQHASIIIDEGQDFSDNAYRLIRALAGEEHPNDIFIVGDSHQRILRFLSVA